MSEQTHPWDRAYGESSQAFSAFCTYRDLGPTRSLSKAAELTPVGVAMLKIWSAEWGWVERARAWDAELDRQRTEAAIAETREMAARHARQAAAAQEAAMQPIVAVLEAARADAGFRDRLLEEGLGGVLSQALSAAAKLPGLQGAERLARGEPTSISEHVVLSELPPDHLEGVLAALGRAGLVVQMGDGDGDEELEEELEVGEPDGV